MGIPRFELANLEKVYFLQDIMVYLKYQGSLPLIR